MTTPLDLDITDSVATITIDRPEHHNTLTLATTRDLVALLDELDRRDDVRAVVVTGRGRVFCAGADLGLGTSTFDAEALGDAVPRSDDGRVRDGGGLIALRVYEMRKPVIAAINGAAAGVGLTMTLPMDARLASSEARFAFPFVRRGIVPEACSSWFLPRLVGPAQALEWCLTGRTFGAEEALAGRLVRSVHAPDELLAAAHQLAAEMVTRTSEVSVALTRAMLWQMLGATHPIEAHRVDSHLIVARGVSADASEGITSFLEKRPPIFPDRLSDADLDLPGFEHPGF